MKSYIISFRKQGVGHRQEVAVRAETEVDAFQIFRAQEPGAFSLSIVEAEEIGAPSGPDKIKLRPKKTGPRKLRFGLNPTSPAAAAWGAVARLNPEDPRVDLLLDQQDQYGSKQDLQGLFRWIDQVAMQHIVGSVSGSTPEQLTAPDQMFWGIQGPYKIFAKPVADATYLEIVAWKVADE